MTRYQYAIALSSLVFALGGCTATTTTTQEPSQAQIFEDMGPHCRTITSSSSEAQAYFDQGLTWTYAFNHDEAIRSFTHVTELDPDCAMAWWGISYCNGPNYNDPIMTDERNEAAWDALQKTLARIDNASPRERALIEALATRYAKPWPEDRAPLDEAYSSAMAEVWASYPNDSDVGTLYAESMMVKRPWKLYSLDYVPAEETPEIVFVLEQVMEMDPDNPGANHLYIHVVEPSADPYRGLPAAGRLGDMVPASGHLLHMPSHIYVKTGRWDDAIVQNEKAMASDAEYRALSPNQGIQYLYMVHNAHMLAYAAMMSGREEEAMVAARAMWADVPEEVMVEVGPFFDKWMCSVYDVQKRFGRWEAILEEPAPPSYLPLTVASWRAHRAVAYAALKDFENAELEYQQFLDVKNSLPDDALSGLDNAHAVLDVSDYFVRGEIALQRGDYDTAAELLEHAAAIEDSMVYGEPPQWLQPSRHALGAVYMVAGKYEDAERVYRKDLALWPDNGWSLYGLSRALAEQGRDDEAIEVEHEYHQAWARADEPTKTSCKCVPET